MHRVQDVGPRDLFREHPLTPTTICEKMAKFGPLAIHSSAAAISELRGPRGVSHLLYSCGCLLAQIVETLSDLLEDCFSLLQVDQVKFTAETQPV